LRSAEEANTIIQDRMREGDIEGAELLIRVKNVWDNLADCLSNTNNAHTEREIGRLFCDHCVFLVNFCVREASNTGMASKCTGLEADFAALSEGMHKLLLRKVDAQKELRKIVAAQDSLPAALGGVECEAPVDLSEAQHGLDEGEQIELLAGKIVA
jgi:hypothetical protein